MEMQFKNEIKKLADVVVWADNQIEALKIDFPYVPEEHFRNFQRVSELEAIKKVVLETIERHTVYINALNEDIATGIGTINRLKTKIEDLETAIKKQHQDDITEYNKVKRREMELQNMVTGKNQKIKRLENELEGRKEEYTALKVLMDTKYIPIDDHNDVCKAYEKKVAELEKENKRLKNQVSGLNEELREFEEKVDHWKNQERIRTDQLRATESKVDELHKSINRLTLHCRTKNEEIENLKKALEKIRTTKDLDLKGHNRREMALVNELADKNDEIKGFKEENSYLKKINKDKNDMIRKAYDRYVNEACKGREEIIDECYKNLTKDETGYTGFKQYALRALEKKEGNEKEAKEFICDTVDVIFYNKKAKEKRKEEETEVKDFDEYHKYEWFPCGEDSIE